MEERRVDATDREDAKHLSSVNFILRFLFVQRELGNFGVRA